MPRYGGTALFLVAMALISQVADAGRYYDSKVGRFLAIDSKFEKFSEWSPYNYALNNPLVNIDPDGKEVKNRHYSSIVNFFSFLGLRQSTEYYNVESAITTLRSTETGEKLYQELHSSPQIIEVGAGRLPDQIHGGNIVARQLGATGTNIVKKVIEVTVDFAKIETQITSGGMNKEEFLGSEKAPAIVTAHEFGHVKDILDRTITKKNSKQKEDYAKEFQKKVRDELRTRSEEEKKKNDNQQE